MLVFPSMNIRDAKTIGRNGATPATPDIGSRHAAEAAISLNNRIEFAFEKQAEKAAAGPMPGGHGAPTDGLSRLVGNASSGRQAGA